MAGLWAFLGAVAGAFLAIFTQVSGGWINRRVETRARQKRELALLKGEFRDIQRHCDANLEIIDNIDLSRGIPLRIHFDKMMIYESSIIFSADTYRSVHERYSEEIYRVKTMIRNMNLEVEFFGGYISRNTAALARSQALAYFKEKMIYVRERNGFEISCIDGAHGAYSGPSRPKYVIFEPVSDDKMTDSQT